MTEDEMRTLIRAECTRVGSQAKLARDLGISAVYLSDVLSGRRAVSRQLSNRLGFSKEIIFVPKNTETA